MNNKHTGSMIVLAWPDTLVRKTNAWYDPIMDFLGFSKNGYYKVGHAAFVLVNKKDGKLHYFDFGRYHTPHGYGRVRDEETDPELTIPITAIFQKNTIKNLEEILAWLYSNKSTHGTGRIIASVYHKLNFDTAYFSAKQWQSRDTVPYGPFIVHGTNCSRFVATILRAGIKNSFKKYLLHFPYVISASPISNTKIANSNKILLEFRQKKLAYKPSLLSRLYNPLP